MPRSRSKSKSQPLNNLPNENPVDKKTKQLLFHECAIQAIHRTKIKGIEPFSQTKANELFGKYFKKKSPKCVCYCLIDRIRFQKKGAIGSSLFRKQVNYREIKHFFVFPSQPDSFMLCIQDDITKKRAYELYYCSKSEDVNTICSLAYKAANDADGVLYDVVPIRQISMQSKDFVNDTSSMEDLDKISQSSVPIHLVSTNNEKEPIISRQNEEPDKIPPRHLAYDEGYIIPIYTFYDTVCKTNTSSQVECCSEESTRKVVGDPSTHIIVISNNTSTIPRPSAQTREFEKVPSDSSISSIETGNADRRSGAVEYKPQSRPHRLGWTRSPKTSIVIEREEISLDDVPISSKHYSQNKVDRLVSPHGDNRNDVYLYAQPHMPDNGVKQQRFSRHSADEGNNYTLQKPNTPKKIMIT